MSPTSHNSQRPLDGAEATAVDPGVEHAMETLSRLGSDLLESYQTLAQRAEHVEEQLCRSNAELELKVGQLDAVSRDLAAILDALPTGVVVRDAAGRVVRINDAALAILGSRGGALLGSTERPFYAASPDQEPAAGWQQSEVTLGNGERRVLALRRSAIATGRGDQAPGSVEILDDRTEVVELSERLHSLDKLAALGNMAGGIAHEIRNPMNAIKGFAALLDTRLAEGSKEREWAGLIVEGVSESERILTSMLTLARPDGLVLETVDGQRLVQDALTMAQNDAVPTGTTSPWAVTFECAGPEFSGDRIKLRQALRNLIANAFEAQPGGGSVHVTLTVDETLVRLDVQDAGPGVPAELRARILDPFFTTRAEGTGLGLALVSTIAQLHGGHLGVSPSSGSLGGAEFSIQFPSRTAA